MTDGAARVLDQTVHEDLKYGGPDLWKILHIRYNKMFDSAAVPSESLMGMILPLFKGKRQLQDLWKRQLQGHNNVSSNE